MMSILFVIPAVCVLFLWRLFKGYVLRSPLDKLPGPPRGSFAKGNMIQIHERHAWKFMDHLTNAFGPVVKLTGFMNARVLWVFDPKALHHVVLKDQDVYEEAEFMIMSRTLAFGPGLFSTTGDHHRRQRKLLNPVFSIAHLRHLTPIFFEVMHRVGALQSGIERQIKSSSNNEVDVLDWMGRAALELMGKGALGHSFDLLVEDVPNAYAEALKKLSPTIVRCIGWRLVSPLYKPIYQLQEKYPSLKKFIKNCYWIIPDRNLQDLKAIIDVMDETSCHIYEEKKRALVANDLEAKNRVEEGKDLMSVLLRANMEAAEEDRLPELEVISQISALTFAGTDTTSSALSRILQLLCSHQEVQDKLREEIVAAQAANDGQDLCYDDLVKLPYLDAVCRETLRLYPPAPFGAREAKRDMVLPLSEPMRCVDDTYTETIFVPKGTTVMIANYSSNRNKALWGPDAEEWKPDRWMNEGVLQSVLDARIPGVYSNLMTFSGGGRACIGFKFSQLEMKVVLVLLLSSFRFSQPAGDKANIFWNRASVTWPSVGPKAAKASLPLILEVITA